MTSTQVLYGLNNCDNRILAEIVNIRIAKILPNITHLDQTGFVSNRLLQSNIRTRLRIIQCARRKWQ